jgi:hypothetical protein
MFVVSELKRYSTSKAKKSAKRMVCSMYSVVIDCASLLLDLGINCCEYPSLLSVLILFFLDLLLNVFAKNMNHSSMFMEPSISYNHPFL